MRNNYPNMVLNKFLLYYFRSHSFRQWLKKESRGSNINNLNQELLSKLMIGFPLLEEQKRIITYLDTKCTSIDSAINHKQSVIDKLTEYKKSLIYEVVTGKREV